MFRFGIPVGHKGVKSDEVRDNFEALATTNATSREDEPKSPRNGMLRVFAPEDSGAVLLQLFWNSWRTLLCVGGTITAAMRTDKAFTSSTNWVFDHNLGDYSIVQCIDTTTNEVIHPEKIEHASVNRVIVTHSRPVTGKIIVVG